MRNNSSNTTKSSNNSNNTSIDNIIGKRITVIVCSRNIVVIITLTNKEMSTKS